MAYTRGSSSNIIVGAAALWTYEAGTLTDADLPTLVEDTSFKKLCLLTQTSVTLVTQ